MIGVSWRATPASPRAEALQRYLGVHANADPREVLAIRGAVLTEARVEAAAQRRWRQVAEHPAAGEPAAHFARSAIVHAAETLLGRVPGSGVWRSVEQGIEDSPRWQLDRRIVEAIRSSGGMNREAALRLARIGAIAGMEAPQVLERVRELVASGGFRARPRPSGGWRVARRLVRRGSGVPREIARLLEEVESVVDEAVQPDATRRRENALTVAAIAVLLAVVVPVSIWRWMPSRSGEERAVTASGGDSARGGRDPGSSVGRDDASRPSAADASIVPAGSSDRATVVRFTLPPGPASTPPPFLEERRAAARRAAPDVPGRLEDLAGQIRGRNGVVDGAPLEAWRSIQSIPARCWFDESPALLRRILGASRDVVAAVETWTAAEQLLAELGDLDPRNAGADRIRAGAWGAGLVGDLVRQPGLAAAVRDQLQQRLDVLGLPPRTGWVAPDPFEETAARWLAAVVESLAGPDEPEDREEAWAVWRSVVAEIEPVRLREALLVEGIRRLLRAWEDGDESTARPRRVADLLDLLGPAVAFESEGVATILEEVATPGGRHAHPDAAWVLSSLIAARPEFVDWSPVAPDADGATRARWLEAALASWPLPATPASGVDPERLRRARELVGLATQRSRRDPVATISLLRTVGRLNAALADREPSRARARVVFEEVELDLRGSGDLGVDPPLAAAEPASLDGRFAGAMRQALENREIRVDLVRELRRRGGGDLGPNDAAALAKAAVKDAPEVRQAASAVLIERFASGPVALEAYLGAIDGSETDPLVRRTVERLAGVALPDTRGPDAAVEVRHRLADRLLELLPSEARRLDRAMAGYAATLAARRDAASDLGNADPVVEAAQLASARLTRLEGRPVMDALLDDRDRRRGIAEGPSQRLAGELITLVEAELAIARLARPDLLDAIDRLAADAVRRRQRSRTSLEQALEMELVLAELAILVAGGSEA